MTTALDRSNIQPVIVAPSLAELNGPVEGTVELPVHVDWTPANKYDLATPKRVQTMYRTVLQQARVVNDLQYLNAAVLRRVWAGLRLSRPVRRAWEEAFPELAGAH